MNTSQKEEYKIIKNTSRQCTNIKNQRKNAQGLQMLAQSDLNYLKNML